MPCIQISKDYRITTDAQCWRVEKYAGIEKKTGNQKWNPVAYYSDLPSAGEGLFQRLVRGSDATTFEKLRQDAQEIKTLLKAVISG